MESFDIRTTEIEYKYAADTISLSKFNQFAKSLNPSKYIEVGGWDIYYASKIPNTYPFEFMRLRLGDKPELTVKIKTDDKNNNNRIELNLPLDRTKTNEDLETVIAPYCKLFGFVESFRIFKYCSIYNYEKTDIVHYTVFNEEMKELGRFLEIEVLQNSDVKSEAEAWELLKDLEQKLSIFGISPQNRSKKSQFERWHK